MRKLFLCAATFSVMLVVLIVATGKKDATPPQLPQIPQHPNRPNIPDRRYTLQEAVQKIVRSDVEATLRYFTSEALEGRMSGMKGNREAAEYCFKFYQALGMQTQYQEFSIRGLNEHKEKSTGKTANIIAVLPGNHPTLKEETIIVGAHMDHIGYGPAMSQSPSRREIHPGADDNASGATALLYIARASSLLKGQNQRRIVFISFSAEEMGLIGAEYYVRNPVYGNMVFMLNMDMIGRYRNKGSLSCLGAASSPEVKAVCEKITGYPFRANPSGGGGGGSDHAPFYQKGIPICFLHTGQHREYHTPDDKADLIDFEGLTQIARFATEVVWGIDKLPTKPSSRGVVGEKVPFHDHDFEGWKK